MRLALTLTSSLAMSSSAFAAFVDGNFLYKVCKEERSFCTAYIQGVADGQEGAAKEYVCVPENVSSSQARDIVFNWLRDNPAERHNPAAWLTIVALMKVFPCEK